MKKLILIPTLCIAAFACFGQTLQKGNLVGVHASTIHLDPNVTMNQYKDFYMSTLIPEFEKNFPGVKGYLAKAIRGENENSFGVIWIYESEKVRDKYFNADGSWNDLGKATVAKLQATLDKLNKLGTSTAKYTDWVVQ